MRVTEAYLCTDGVDLVERKKLRLAESGTNERKRMSISCAMNEEKKRTCLQTRGS